MYEDRESFPKWLLILIVLLVVVPLSMGILMMFYVPSDDHMFGFPMFPFWGFGMLIGIIPIIVILLIIWLLLREPEGRPPYYAYGSQHYPPAYQYQAGYSYIPRPQWLDELDARYAKGELSREEYMRIRDDIARGRQ